ncbi:MAG TPA: prolyl oligopeptidase family serine peptidase [Candidatus Limnocylindrales bacterium]
MPRGPARFFAIGLAVIFVSFISGCATIFSATLYDRLTLVAPDCGGGYSGATPASFRAWVDSTPYLMPDYQDVRFPSRDPAITIDAWWIPGPTADAPAVVLAHGLHECKRATTVLFPAGALHRHGYSVLVIDLRNEGSSTIDNGRDTGGTGEARDMLGAWDWLRDAKGLAAGRIGLFGVSLGAGAAIIAGGDEAKVAAVWEDSGFADLTQVLKHQMGAYFIPALFVDLAVAIGRLRGEEIDTRPVEALDRLAGRPIAIVAGERDGAVPVEQAYQLIANAKAHGGQPVVWILPDVGHVGAMSTDPLEYERRLVAFFDGSLVGTAHAGDP